MLLKCVKNYVCFVVMKKGDVSAQIEMLRGMREETPAVAAVPSAPLSKSKAAVETIYEAQAHEFPMRPVGEGTSKGPAVKRAPKAKADPKGGVSVPAPKTDKMAAARAAKGAKKAAPKDGHDLMAVHEKILARLEHLEKSR